MAVSADNLKPFAGWPTLAVFGKGVLVNLRQDFSPVAADFIVPTFTKNLKVGHPDALGPEKLPPKRSLDGHPR